MKSQKNKKSLKRVRKSTKRNTKSTKRNTKSVKRSRVRKSIKRNTKSVKRSRVRKSPKHTKKSPKYTRKSVRKRSKRVRKSVRKRSKRVRKNSHRSKKHRKYKIGEIITNDDGTVTKTSDTAQYEYDWLTALKQEFENSKTIPLINSEIQQKIQVIIQKIEDGGFLTDNIPDITDILTNKPEVLENPFVEVEGIVENKFTMEAAGDPSHNSIGAWKSKNVTPENRSLVVSRILYYLAFSLLLMGKAGKIHKDMTNSDNIHILGNPEDCRIKIFDPKESDVDVVEDPDVTGAAEIIKKLLSDGDVRRAPEVKSKRQRRSRIRDPESGSGSGSESGLGSSRTLFFD